MEFSSHPFGFFFLCKAVLQAASTAILQVEHLPPVKAGVLAKQIKQDQEVPGQHLPRAPSSPRSWRNVETKTETETERKGWKEGEREEEGREGREQREEKEGGKEEKKKERK